MQLHLVKCHVFEVENSRVYIPSLFTDRLKWSIIPMILGSVFLDVAVIWQQDRTILRECVFPKDQNKDIKNSVALFCQHISFQKKVATDKSWSFSLVWSLLLVVYKIKL